MVGAPPLIEKATFLHWHDAFSHSENDLGESSECWRGRREDDLAVESRGLLGAREPKAEAREAKVGNGT